MGDYEEEIDSIGNIRKIHYLGSAILIRNNGRDTLLYAYTDNQGSLTTLTDENGIVLERYAYDPWGKRLNPENWTQNDTRTSRLINRGYTGHEHLDALGIINMNGRVYDPSIAQFLSPDPFIQEPGNWLNYNRYGYCMNNPTNYVDPSGYIRFYSYAYLSESYQSFLNNHRSFFSGGGSGDGGRFSDNTENGPGMGPEGLYYDFLGDKEYHQRNQDL